MWLLLLASIWGASYMFIKIGLRDLSPSMVAFLRIALAAAVLMPVAASQGALRGLGRRAGMLALLGGVQVAGPFYLIPLGEQHISSAMAGILVATTPIFTALLAIWVDHEERSQGLRLAGVVVGIAGVVALFGLDLSGSHAAVLGGLAVVVASLGYAIGSFIVKHRFATARPLGLVACVMTASALLLLPPAAATLPSEAPGAGPLAAVAVLGVLGTGVAFVIFYALIASVGPARTMLVSYVAPGFAVVYGAALLGEEITAATIVGLALIVVGSWLAAEGRLPGAAGALLGNAPRPAPSEARPGR
ncbi:MAG TPA: DMT family transporter [Solirubrobacterales bacterium]|nr:DMT family transporter [Solirubrobacterales bacterium]